MSKSKTKAKAAASRKLKSPSRGAAILGRYLGLCGADISGVEIDEAFTEWGFEVVKRRACNWQLLAGLMYRRFGVEEAEVEDVLGILAEDGIDVAAKQDAPWPIHGMGRQRTGSQA